MWCLQNWPAWPIQSQILQKAEEIRTRVLNHKMGFGWLRPAHPGLDAQIFILDFSFQLALLQAHQTKTAQNNNIKTSQNNSIKAELFF